MSEFFVLSKKQKFGYGTGHVLNDLCASMWFSYLLIFFHDVLKFSQPMAGYLLMLGQVADGISTAFVGYESDRNSCFCRPSRRKSWHLLGTICVALSFPFLFIDCIGCTSDTSEIAMFVYYAPLVVIFQFGWASTQISHLSLIPDLSSKHDDQVFLNSLRYAMTIACNIIVYLLALVFINSQESDSTHISPVDAPAFKKLALTSVAIGVTFSAIFHVLLTENTVTSENITNEIGTPVDKKTDVENVSLSCSLTQCTSLQIKWNEWFKNPLFYFNGMTYMCTRLVVNISQVYLPMYLQYTLNLARGYIAIIPLVCFIAGLFGTVIVRLLSKLLLKEILYLVGCLFVVGSCIWALYLDGSNYQFYGMAIMLGIGTSMMLTIALTMTSCLIGENKETTAFVYGFMSLLDKVSNGVGVALIQNLNPCACMCLLCGIFYKNILSYVVGGVAVVAFISVCLTCVANRKHVRNGYERIE